MTAPTSTGPAGRTLVLLSFSSAYADLAWRIAADLAAANLEVRFDPWEGGGGAPAVRAVAGGLEDVAFVLPLLTPSDAAPTWIGEEWRRAVHDPAVARGVGVLPVRGDGDFRAVPDFLSRRSFADLRERDYAPELRRLVETIRERSGDAGIRLPEVGEEAGSPATVPAEPIALELGAELLAVIEGGGAARRFTGEMVPLMADGLSYELGVEFPELRLRPGSDLPPWSARIVLHGVPEAEVEIRPGSVLVNDSVEAMAELGLSGEPAVNPATGAPCAWVPARRRTALDERGLTIWDAHEFLVLALSALLRRKAADFLGIDEVRAMVGRIEPVFPLLVAETVPKTVSWFVLTDVLRRLVAELVSVRNLRQILLALADWGRVEADPQFLTEYVRAALRRQITHQVSRGTNRLVVFLLHPALEATIRDAARHTATGSYVDLEPERLRGIVHAIREPALALPAGYQVPQILTVTEVRASIRRLVAPSMPWLHVVSYQDLRPDATIQPLGRISRDGFEPRPGVR